MLATSIFAEPLLALEDRGLVELRPAAVACVVARNLVLLAAFAVALIALWRLPAQPRPR